MILLIDNYDSFTYNLYNYLRQLKVTCRVVRNDEITLDQIEHWNPTGIVLSPGPGTPQTAGITPDVVQKFYNTFPLLGICLGFQAISTHWGGQIKKSRVPVHGKTSTIQINNKGLFKGFPKEIQVMRYHSLIVMGLDSTELEIVAYTKEDETPMALQHPHLPIYGVQFHPESVLTEKGLPLLKNWLERINAFAPLVDKD
jgi:anthranilate synthase/aminodeoxychorismate synthase-like glutamine amidotransferase